MKEREQEVPFATNKGEKGDGGEKKKKKVRAKVGE